MLFFPGSTVELYAYFRINENSPLIDPDNIPEFKIYKVGNPSIIYSGLAVKLNTGIYKAVWKSPSSIDTSVSYKIVWIASINGISVPDAEEQFNFQSTGPVFSSDDPVNANPTDIYISQRDLDVIKSVLAWPCTQNVLLSDTQIKQIILYPAMMEYFTKFPLITRDQFAISNQIKIPFPDKYTYGIRDCRVVGKFAQTGGSSNFRSIAMFNKYSPFSNSSTGLYSSKFRGYNPNNVKQHSWMYKYVLDTYGNNATFHYEIDKVNRRVIVTSGVSGFVEIQWAKWSNNFEDVDYPRRIEVINLAQSNLLQHMVDTLQISQETSSEIQIGIAEMQNRATELRERVMEKWDTWQDIHVTRIS